MQEEIFGELALEKKLDRQRRRQALLLLQLILRTTDQNMATGESAAVEAVNIASSSKDSEVPPSNAAQGNVPAQRGPTRAMEVASLRSKYIGAGDLVIVWMVSL